MPAAPEPVRLFVLNPPGWIEVVSPITSDPALAGFGLGERQAIVLAQELRADLLVADDMDARNEAESRHLAVIGTLGVLKLAAGRKLVDFSRAVVNLRDAGFYASDTLVKRLLEDERQ
jgi:predicted nucleic acid-binding protein